MGRRARLKILLSQGSAGSIPVLGTEVVLETTNKKCLQIGGVFYLYLGNLIMV